MGNNSTPPFWTQEKFNELGLEPIKVSTVVWVKPTDKHNFLNQMLNNINRLKFGEKIVVKITDDDDFKFIIKEAKIEVITEEEFQQLMQNT